MRKIMVVVGTRPEVIKMAAVIRALQRIGQPFTFVHTGQHYDYNLSLQFIEELRLPQPDYTFKFRSSSPGVQMGRMLIDLEMILRREGPRLVLVEGDTNSVLAGALAAKMQNIPVGHVEAGLRSFDLRMPEEHNRRLVDHMSSLLFAPTETAKKNLERESVWGSIYVTGNTVMDAVLQHMTIAEKNYEVVVKERLKFKEYALVTVHRAENVEDPVVLKNFVEAFVEAPISLVFPAHPRTVKKLRQFNLWKEISLAENVQLLPPLGYFEFLILMRDCKLILTDSGGLQEEATAPNIRKPVLIIRTSTERPEAVRAGFARVVGVEKGRILEELDDLLENPPKLPKDSPFGEGNAGERIAQILKKEVL